MHTGTNSVDLLGAISTWGIRCMPPRTAPVHLCGWCASSLAVLACLLTRLMPAVEAST
jgi:hypothetical protein